MDGGVDQGPWLQERRGDGSSKEGGGLGLGWLFQRGASKSREGVREGLAWRSGAVQGLRSRDGANAYKKEEKWLFLKDALWGGAGTHRSWPGGRGGRPTLIPGEGLREGLAWRGMAGWVTTRAGLVDGESGRRGKGSGGGARASVPGG